jgi:hypothetical protein
LARLTIPHLFDRPEREIQPLTAAVLADLDRYGYTVERDLELSEMPFDARAMKKKEFFYVVETEALTRGDILAYSDAAFTDLTVQKMKRSGNGVILFVTDTAGEDAIDLSKSITCYGKRDQADRLCHCRGGHRTGVLLGQQGEQMPADDRQLCNGLRITHCRCK